jgi:hypothetical protein
MSVGRIESLYGAGVTVAVDCCAAALDIVPAIGATKRLCRNRRRAHALSFR